MVNQPFITGLLLVMRIFSSWAITIGFSKHWTNCHGNQQDYQPVLASNAGHHNPQLFFYGFFSSYCFARQESVVYPPSWFHQVQVCFWVQIMINIIITIPPRHQGGFTHEIVINDSDSYCDSIVIMTINNNYFDHQYAESRSINKH